MGLKLEEIKSLIKESIPDAEISIQDLVGDDNHYSATIKSKIDGKVVLADEISPDTCRLWDVVSEKKLDKDRFRKDLGNIIQAYQEVARRLGIIHEEANISEIKFGKPKVVTIKNK